MTDKIQYKEIKENIIEVPEGVSLKIEKDNVILEKNGISQKVPFNHVFLTINNKGNSLIIRPNSKKKPYVSVSNTIKKIILNAIEGLDKEYECKLSIVYSHFPITAKVEGDKFIINNFYGEKKARMIKFSPEVNIKVSGKEIIISGRNKQLVGQTAGNIESKTRMKYKDYRVFDDGIYIIEKTK